MKEVITQEMYDAIDRGLEKLFDQGIAWKDLLDEERHAIETYTTVSPFINKAIGYNAGRTIDKEGKAQ